MKFISRVFVAATLLMALTGCKSRASADSDSALAAVASGRKLKIKRKSRAGIKEASGLAVYTNGRDTSLFVVGDRTAKIGVAPWAGAETDLRFRVTDTKDLFASAHLPLPNESQWEAVAVDGSGGVFALRENPAALHIFDSDLGTLRGVINLLVRPGDDIDKDWRRDDNSQGEGLILLKEGHVLILKEKNPVMLIEFGPEGDAARGYAPSYLLGAGEAFTSNDFAPLRPLHAWYPGNSVEHAANDLSEIAADGDGFLYVLSDQAKVILSISGKSDSDIAAGTLSADSDTFRANTSWELPRELDKPEGLAFVEGDRPIVALDDCADDANCVFTLSRLKDE